MIENKCIFCGKQIDDLTKEFCSKKCKDDFKWDSEYEESIKEIEG